MSTPSPGTPAAGPTGASPAGWPHPGRSAPPRRTRGVVVPLLAGLLGLLLLPAVAGAAVFTELRDPTPGSTPSGLVPDDDGVTWFTDPGTRRIGRISATNVVQGFDANVAGTPTGGPPPALTPQRIAVGPDGALWYTITEGGIARMTTAGVVTRYPVVRTGRSAGIVAGPDGAMWFTLPDDDRIGRITAPTDAELSAGSPRGEVATYAVTAGGAPDDIELGTDGALWFAAPGANAIGRAAPADGQGPVVTSIPLPTPGGAPTRVTTGPDGRIWFNAPGTGRIGRIGSNGLVVEMPLPASIGAPGDVAAGPDGALWFVDTGAPGALGRVNDAGDAQRFELPSPEGLPVDLVRGTDGDLRYTRSNARIGRVSTLAPPEQQPLPAEEPPALVPVAGRSVILEVVSGTVRIRRPGRGYEDLAAGGASLPDGTEVDATKGRVRITAETSPGSGITRTGVFWDGRFVIRQARVPGAATELRLTGKLNCGVGVARRASGPPAETRAKRRSRRKPKVGRRLWGDGKGDFRTRGTRATASVRGTRWLVEDRCDKTTRVRVFVGVLSVRDRVRNRRVTLTDGQQYVAPGPRRRR